MSDDAKRVAKSPVDLHNLNHVNLALAQIDPIRESMPATARAGHWVVESSIQLTQVSYSFGSACL